MWICKYYMRYWYKIHCTILHLYSNIYNARKSAVSIYWIIISIKYIVVNIVSVMFLFLHPKTITHIQIHCLICRPYWYNVMTSIGYYVTANCDVIYMALRWRISLYFHQTDTQYLMDSFCYVVFYHRFYVYKYFACMNN